MIDLTRKVDHSSLKVNQIIIIVLNVAAFVLNIWWISAISAGFMMIGTIVGKPGFLFFYKYAAKPLKLIKPYIVEDNPEPHRFAQGFGSIVLIVGIVLIVLNQAVAGWSLIWLVIFLAALNAFFGFCAGCFIYYQLSKIGFPGFSKKVPKDTSPGFRPKLILK